MAQSGYTGYQRGGIDPWFCYGLRRIFQFRFHIVYTQLLPASYFFGFSGPSRNRPDLCTQKKKNVMEARRVICQTKRAAKRNQLRSNKNLEAENWVQVAASISVMAGGPFLFLAGERQQKKAKRSKESNQAQKRSRNPLVQTPATLGKLTCNRLEQTPKFKHRSRTQSVLPKSLAHNPAWVLLRTWSSTPSGRSTAYK